MRRFVLFILGSFLFVPVMSQVARQDVITSAGGYNSAAGVSLSWTLGEMIVPTFSSSNLILTHGFQQLIITPVQKNLESLVKITIYPNPAVDVINLLLDKTLEGEIEIAVIDYMGRLVRTDFMEAFMIEKQINMQDLPGGIYFLRITEGRLSNIYKIVKL